MVYTHYDHRYLHTNSPYVAHIHVLKVVGVLQLCPEPCRNCSGRWLAPALDIALERHPHRLSGCDPLLVILVRCVAFNAVRPPHSIVCGSNTCNPPAVRACIVVCDAKSNTLHLRHVQAFYLTFYTYFTLSIPQDRLIMQRHDSGSKGKGCRILTS